MPQAPMLPPDQMAQAQASAGINPANFLMAAAELHSQGKLSTPKGPTDDPSAGTFSRKPKRNVRIIK